MMGGLSLAPEPAPRPGAAAAMDQYAAEQLSTRLKYVFGRCAPLGTRARARAPLRLRAAALLRSSRAATRAGARRVNHHRWLLSPRRLDSKGDGRIDVEELAAMLVQLGCTPRKKLKGDRETVLCVATRQAPPSRALPHPPAARRGPGYCPCARGGG
eukprot:COSAG06_NODE_1615_length_8927_cov_12.501699_8_plen_157_part_00